MLEVLKHSKTYKVNNQQNNLELFTCPINANQFDYHRMVESLLESVADFSVSRRTKEQYQGSPMTLSQKAREKFREYKENKGELGEFLLFCFLEGHLNAPKILSKLELKTSTELYVNGSDGIHFLKLPSGNYQLIFGESKLYEDLTDGLRDAFLSINDFLKEENQKGKEKSGIRYEKSLLSASVFKETWSKEEEDFITQLVYPTNKQPFEVDDAFGIFIGFEIELEKYQRRLPNDKFRDMIDDHVNKIVEMKIANIEKYIEQHELFGYNFYVYTMPFLDIEISRTKILESLIK
ncbi:hypothetical protein BSK66_09955 [Paenibacillus odorifer]|uniref:Anti-bacteriophage protein A/HamA C-terminal domain-containing protein n=2 Tax=Paenibacillus TaxID=44249 RepID=A0A1R0XE11_9BACL|nr:hypothetical protein BJP51_12540 [Paenibacillus odorifer]OME59787.1 hypothetical protein BSK66_09955 [Paenibacillus odorifer]